MFGERKVMADILRWTVTAGLMLLVIAGVIVGVQEFRDTQTNTTIQYEILNDTLNMFENTGDQLATVGTMIGIGLLIGVILIAFVARKRGMF